MHTRMSSSTLVHRPASRSSSGNGGSILEVTTGQHIKPSHSKKGTTGNGIHSAKQAEMHATATDKKIEAQTEVLRHLYPRYQTRHLEFGLHLIQLNDLTAHHGNGKFTQIVTHELGIPRSTVYDAMDFAEAELKRITKDSLSENRTNSEDDDTITEFDWDDPKDVARILKLAYPEGVPKPVRKPKPYIKSTQLHLILDRNTRRDVAAAWKLLKKHRDLHKALCNKIAKEVIDAANKISEKTDD